MLNQDYLCLLVAMFILEIFGACLGLLFGCYCLLCVLTVLNVVCIYVEVLFLSLYALGFCFWSFFFYYFCFIQCSFFFSPRRIFFLLILCGVINTALCSTFVEARLFVLSQFSYLSWRFVLAWPDLFVGCKLKNAPASAECAHGRRAV